MQTKILFLEMKLYAFSETLGPLLRSEEPFGLNWENIITYFSDWERVLKLGKYNYLLFGLGKGIKIGKI